MWRQFQLVCDMQNDGAWQYMLSTHPLTVTSSLCYFPFSSSFLYFSGFHNLSDFSYYFSLNLVRAKFILTIHLNHEPILFNSTPYELIDFVTKIPVK